jgi:hypothetical protein
MIGAVRREPWLFRDARALLAGHLRPGRPAAGDSVAGTYALAIRLGGHPEDGHEFPAQGGTPRTARRERAPPAAFGIETIARPSEFFIPRAGGAGT